MDAVGKLNKWQATPRGALTVAVVSLASSYLFISIAIDTANLWSYTAGVISVFIFLNNLFNFAKVRKGSVKRNR